MPLTKQTWDVVAFGRWNPGILTPRGIVERLFTHSTSDSPEYEVEYPEDAVGPCRVNYDRLRIAVTDTMLMVRPSEVTFADLHRAMAVVKKAMETLPETPVSGVAITLRYAGAADGSLPSLEESLRHPWENRFGAAGQKILNRSVSYSVECKTGNVLLTLGEKPSVNFRLTVSFRQFGPREKMLSWLSMEAALLQEKVTVLFRDVLRLDEVTE